MQNILVVICKLLGFPGGSSGRESACNAGAPGDTGLISGSGRSPGGGNGNLLQYSCLGNSMDRGAWWATVHGAAKSRTQLKQFSAQHACKFFLVACGIYFPEQGLNPGPLYWELRVLASGPPGKSFLYCSTFIHLHHAVPSAQKALSALSSSSGLNAPWFLWLAGVQPQQDPGEPSG